MRFLHGAWKCLHKQQAAELVCSAAYYPNCHSFQQLQISAVRRRHVRRRRHHPDVHRHHLDVHHRRRLMQHAKLVRAMLLSAERCCALPAGRRWDAPRWIEERHYCCVLVRRRRRVQNCCDWPPRRRRRDSSRHHHRRTGGRPSRGRSPNRPTGPCPERCRCRSSPARKTRRARRSMAHSHSSHRNNWAECRPQLIAVTELPASTPDRQAVPSYRRKS